MKRKIVAVKNTGKLVKAQVTAGAGVVKKEIVAVLNKVKKVTSSANRKGKAAVRAIKS